MLMMAQNINWSILVWYVTMRITPRTIHDEPKWVDCSKAPRELWLFLRKYSHHSKLKWWSNPNPPPLLALKLSWSMVLHPYILWPDQKIIPNHIKWQGNRSHMVLFSHLLLAFFTLKGEILNLLYNHPLKVCSVSPPITKTLVPLKITILLRIWLRCPHLCSC